VLEVTRSQLPGARTIAATVTGHGSQKQAVFYSGIVGVK
jgi:hypothetical protein